MQFVIHSEISNIIELIMQCDVTSCIICISNKVEYPKKEESEILYQRSYVLLFEQSFQCNQSCVGQIFLL